jgi:hypothetical protein
MTTDISRRHLTFLFSSFAASLATAQPKQLPTLSSKVYTNDEIAYHGDQAKKGREFFNGLTHSGFNVEVHETLLSPGTETHAPHRHEQDLSDLILPREVSPRSWASEAVPTPAKTGDRPGREGLTNRLFVSRERVLTDPLGHNSQNCQRMSM